MSERIALVWFRRDLRVDDNPALSAALRSGLNPVALYALDDKPFFSPGGAQRWFIHHALIALSRRLADLGVPLLVRAGDEAKTVLTVARETRAGAAFWNRRYDADGIATDTNIKSALKEDAVDAFSYNGSLLREPWEIETKTGGPYRVFTPFWRALRNIGPGRDPAPALPNHQTEKSTANIDAITALKLTPTAPNWAREFSQSWAPSEEGAQLALEHFLSAGAASYSSDRDRPDREATSRLSPHLAVGTISPLRVWRAAIEAAASGAATESEIEKFLSELAWREFAYHLLFHFPGIVSEPLRSEFRNFPWKDDDAAFERWSRGETGVPIIDAGMRQLWRTGWMHNRVRMIVASYLTKNLLIDWRRGERWFWDTLVDADPANNPVSWQWVAGSGADAAPYFRIFNPVTQGEKFDPAGDYVRRFVPEIAALPNEKIHRPAGAPGFRVNDQYFDELVDLGQSRKRALEAYQSLKG